MASFRIDDERVTADTAALVRLDSSNPGPQEGAVVAWVAARLAELGIDALRQQVRPGRNNLIARTPGREPGAPRLVLSAHGDVVPPGDGWSVDPFGGEIRDGRLWGRGSADMKSGLALALGALAALRRSGPARGEVVFALTVDEEAPAMLGIHALVEAGHVTADDGVLALEPTGLRLRIAHVGLRWLRARVTGRQAHAGRAHLGVDANHAMARAVDLLKARVAALPHEDPLLGRPRFTVGTIRGGVAPNVVPGACEAQLDLRLVPPMTPGDIETLAREAFDDALADFPGAAAELLPLGVARPPVRASDDAHLVRTLRAAFESATGAPLETGGADGHEAYTDAAMAAALLGSDRCVAFGPGSSDVAHTADEYVPLREIETACRVLEELIARW